MFCKWFNKKPGLAQQLEPVVNTICAAARENKPTMKIFEVQLTLSGRSLEKMHIAAKTQKAAVQKYLEEVEEELPHWEGAQCNFFVRECSEAFVL